MKQQKLNSKEYYINEINRLKEEKKLVEQELKKTQAELYRAHLEKDVYEKAAEILKRSDEKIYEIAKKVGYSNNDYFINKFTQIKGKTPFKYRKEFLEQEEKVL